MCKEYKPQIPVNKSDFIKGLTEQEFNAGTIKFNIPDPDVLGTTLNGEGVWGWLSPEDKSKYLDDSFFGEIKAILLNYPFNYSDLLTWGDEVIIRCNGSMRPVLSEVWIKECLAEKTKSLVLSLGGNDADVEQILDEVKEAGYTSLNDIKQHLKNYYVDAVELLDCETEYEE